MVETLLQIFILFAEPGFPAVDVSKELMPLEGATVVTSVEQLESELIPGRILVWRHGSAFPADAWPAFVRFLENGGSFLHVGGEPFTRPVTGAAGQRVVGPRTVSLLKELRLNQCYRIDVGEHVLKHRSGLPSRTVAAGTWTSVLEPRLSDTKDFDHEDGAPGSRDAILRPLSHYHRVGEDPRFPVAAASFAIDRLRGRFPGGRWVFALGSTAPTAQEMEQLLAEARRPSADLRVNPTYGCYHPGEAPRVRISLHRPLATDVIDIPVSLSLSEPGGQSATTSRTTLVRSGVHGTAEFAWPSVTKPGLYRVQASIPGLESQETGFWIFDEALFKSGDDLSFDNYTMRRNGVPEPVVGTTTMSRTVHRKFLFEPNAAVWDDTFAELSSLGINFVRTGVWSAYRKISLDPHVVDEAWLRALEAYYLSARRHGIPVLFTFFAFVPESFGGANPYLDPRSLEGQKAYISTVVRRFSGTQEMMWDLINEPSFSSPKKLWQCRPNGDRYESAAFTSWLRERYSPRGSGQPDWETVVRRRWRLRPDEGIGLPDDSDFADRHHLGTHRPYRAKEFVHFAQDAFEGWIREMSRTIRNAGSSAAIVVGQDEGGLNERPHPLFHHRSVDFTSMHTWWYNDALLWDGVMSKARGKPLLISETGVMQRELLSGEAIRTPESRAALFSRKVGHAFAAGGFGVVQWCYEINPFMASDNEVAIGARRVDGSYRPEHRVLRQLAGFVARNRARFDTPAEPEVVLVFPSSDHYGARSHQLAGTRRAVEILFEQEGVPVQMVPEHRTRDLGFPDTILLPACRGVADAAWADIENAVTQGATLICSGWFETDDAGLPAARIGAARRRLARVEPVGSERWLRYSLAVTDSWFASQGAGDLPGGWRQTSRGRGTILHHPLPIEWATGSEVQRELYDRALEAAGVTRSLRGRPGVPVRQLQFRQGRLVVIVNETSRAAAFDREELGGTKDFPEITVRPGFARMLWIGADGGLVDDSGG